MCQPAFQVTSHAPQIFVIECRRLQNAALAGAPVLSVNS